MLPPPWIKTVRKRSKARRVRKRKVAKYILSKVKQVKAKSGECIANDLLEEEWSCDYEEVWWTDNIQSMCPRRYY